MFPALLLIKVRAVKESVQIVKSPNRSFVRLLWLLSPFPAAFPCAWKIFGVATTIVGKISPRENALRAYNRLANTYSSNRRSCSYHCFRPYPRFFSARVSQSRWFSGRIANRRRSSKTWDYRDSSFLTHGDTPCRVRYRVSGILWTRDRALSARSLVYPVQQQRFKVLV